MNTDNCPCEVKNSTIIEVQRFCEDMAKIGIYVSEDVNFYDLVNLLSKLKEQIVSSREELKVDSEICKKDIETIENKFNV